MKKEETHRLSDFAWDIFKTSGNIESYLLYNELHLKNIQPNTAQQQSAQITVHKDVR